MTWMAPLTGRHTATSEAQEGGGRGIGLECRILLRNGKRACRLVGHGPACGHIYVCGVTGSRCPQPSPSPVTLGQILAEYNEVDGG